MRGLGKPLSEELRLPKLLLSEDRLGQFEEELKAHCSAIRTWENSVQAEDKDIEHYIKLYNLIDGLDCLDAFVVSLSSETITKAKKMIVQEKKALLEEFGMAIQGATRNEVSANPSMTIRLAAMYRPIEAQDSSESVARKQREDYFLESQTHYSFRTRPLPEFNEEVMQILIGLQLIDKEGRYKFTNLTKIIIAILEDRLGESIAVLDPCEKINLVEKVLAHSYERVKGTDELIKQMAIFEEANAVRNKQAGRLPDEWREVEAFVVRTKDELIDVMNDNLSNREGQNKEGWRAIQFLEANMKPNAVRDYLIFKIKSLMIQSGQEFIEMNQRQLEKMIEEAEKVMGLRFTVLEIKDEYFMADVFHEKLGSKPIRLAVIVSDINDASHSPRMGDERFSVIRLKKKPLGAHVTENFFHELTHMLRNHGIQSEERTNFTHVLDGSYHELPSMFFELFYSRSKNGRTKASLDDNFKTLAWGQLVLFRRLCRERIRELTSEVITEIASRREFENYTPNTSVKLKPNCEEYIVSRIAALKGLALMDRLKLEEQEEFLHAILRLFMNCRDRDLGEAYYELLAQWESDKAAA